MVCDWKPDSSRDLAEPRMPEDIEGPTIPVESEDSAPEEDNYVLPVEMMGQYQLLPSDMMQGLNYQPDHLSSSSNSDDSDESSEESVGEISDPQLAHMEGWEKSEIQVDPEEIRSLMKGFNLPDSAVPEWASNIPESAFTSFIWEKMKPN